MAFDFLCFVEHNDVIASWGNYLHRTVEIETLVAGVRQILCVKPSILTFIHVRHIQPTPGLVHLDGVCTAMIVQVTVRVGVVEHVIWRTLAIFRTAVETVLAITHLRILLCHVQLLMF